jgi:hypothetical protein
MKTKHFTILILLFITVGVRGQTKETNPDYLLRLHGPWKTHESQNFRFYYRENSRIKMNLSVSDLESIASTQQANLYRIGDLLSIPYEKLDTLRKINVWMFKDLNEKTEITKIHATDFAIHPYWSIYCTYSSAKSAHELGHIVIDEYWGHFKSEKYQFVIEEGFASLIDEGHGARDFDYFKKAKRITRSRKYSITNVINNAYVTGIFRNPYTQKAIVAGAFVKFLIEEHGVDKFKILWLTLRDDGQAFALVYGKPIEEIATDFTNFLSEL